MRFLWWILEAITILGPEYFSFLLHDHEGLLINDLYVDLAIQDHLGVALLLDFVGTISLSIN